MTQHKATEKEARRVVEGGEADQWSLLPGDNRTPDKTIGQIKYAHGQGTARDERVQERPPDKQLAHQSQAEGPASYAPHQEDEDMRARPGQDPAKKKTGEFR
jgi:hypothetical protein